VVPQTAVLPGRGQALQFWAPELRAHPPEDSQRDRKCRSARFQRTVPKGWLSVRKQLDDMHRLAGRRWPGADARPRCLGAAGTSSAQSREYWLAGLFAFGCPVAPSGAWGGPDAHRRRVFAPRYVPQPGWWDHAAWLSSG